MKISNSKLKKIGIDARFYGPHSTGIGRHIAEIIKHLAKQDKNNEYIIFLNHKNYSNFKLPGKNFRKIKTINTYYDFAEQTTFLKHLNKENLDLMHFPHFNAPILYNRPFVITIHDLIPFLYPGKKHRSLFRKKIFKHIFTSNIKRAKQIFAVSEHTKKDLVKTFRINPKKITITHNAVAEEFKKPIPKTEQLRVKNKYKLPDKFLFYYGLFRYHKNLSTLVEAIRILKANNESTIPYSRQKLKANQNQISNQYSKFSPPSPRGKSNLQFPISNIQLILAGKPDPLYPEVAELRKKYKLQKQIKMLGFIPDKDLKAILAQATIFTFPSLYEGFGIPPLEAMSMGVPVICSNAASIPEACGNAAIFFNPLDPKELARKIEKLLTNKPLRQNLIKKGKKQADKFSWETTTKTILKTYLKFNQHP